MYTQCIKEYTNINVSEIVSGRKFSTKMKILYFSRMERESVIINEIH